jgi:hypothetical protein
MTRRTPSCDWVRARLPLEIGRDDGDFTAKERAKLSRHLADCESCRRDRAELADAMAALSAVAAVAPVEPHSPSLWPGLELRIRERELSRQRPATPPFRLPPALSSRLDRCRDFLSDRGVRPRPGIALGGLAAALLCGVIALQADRARPRGRLEIAPEPRPAVAETPAPADDWDFDTEIDVAAEDGGSRWLWHSSPRTFAASSGDDAADESRPGLPGPLAQADIHPDPRRPSTGGSENSGSGTSAITSSSKYDFDLERGTPMPPDSRDAKAAY